MPNPNTALKPAAEVTSPGSYSLAREGGWTTREAELIAKVIAKDLNRGELSMFAAICRHTQLDPFRKQIYAWKDAKEGRVTIHIAVDGLRSTAARTGEYEGQIGPEWCGPDGKWRDVWLEQTPPAACRVGVLHRGWANPVWATATWSEFHRNTPIWKEKPSHMLAIRAEGHALRRAFPEIFDGFADQLAAMNATISVDDPQEMEAIEGRATAVIAAVPDPEWEGEQDRKRHEPEPAQDAPDEAQEDVGLVYGLLGLMEAVNEGHVALSGTTLEEWNGALIEEMERQKVRPVDLSAATNLPFDPARLHVEMTLRGIDLPALVALGKKG